MLLSGKKMSIHSRQFRASMVQKVAKLFVILWFCGKQGGYLHVHM